MTRLFLILALLSVFAMTADAQELYRMADSTHTRWISFENPTGAPGQGARENQGAKGHAFDTLEPGRSVTLADIEGTGIIQRMWITLSDRSPKVLRALRLQMFWDAADEPAVDVPFGDFFGAGLGTLVPFENALFSSPEGRSFTMYLPMPFRSAARMVLTNESDATIHLFYDLNYTLVDTLGEDALYFHAHWRRERPTTLGRDFVILPKVEGRGRYLGAHLGVVTDPQYGSTWWGEGEVKIYLDDDTSHPTLAGTGTEDYIGTGYGQGVFLHRYQGSLVADAATRRWSFYRYHVPDPVYFHTACRVTLQQIGGAPKAEVLRLLDAGAALRPITIDSGGRGAFRKFLEMEAPPDLAADDFPDGWINFYRQDDVSALVYFYHDRPTNALPALAPVDERTAGLE